MRCRLLSVVGNDGFGVWLGEQFRGVAAALPICNAPTSVSVGILHACGERTIFTTKWPSRGAHLVYVRPLLPRAPTRNRSIVFLSGVFQTPLSGSYSRLIDDIAALGYRVALDTGWPSSDWDDDLRGEVFDGSRHATTCC